MGEHAAQTEQLAVQAGAGSGHAAENRSVPPHLDVDIGADMGAGATTGSGTAGLTRTQQLLAAGVPASDIILTSADMFERLRLGSTSGYRELAKYVPVALAPGRWRLSDVHLLEHATATAALAAVGILPDSAPPPPPVQDPRTRRRTS